MREWFSRLDARYGNSGFWQFLKFNVVGWSVCLLQLILANVLPFLFDSLKEPLPTWLRVIFSAEALFDGPSPYVVDGAVTWGYVLPFFLSNAIANIYGYFVNGKATFEGKVTRSGFVIYVSVLTGLILFSTWLQGAVTSCLAATGLAPLSRTIAAYAAGLIQLAVLFPLERFVIFKK